MKTLTKILVIAAIIAMPIFASAKEGDVHETTIGVNNVYIPSGFDSGSEAFVVASGWFPHSCYKLKGAKVEHVGPTLHEVTVMANVTEGLCLTVIIPFNKEIQLGKLAVGDHQIKFMNGDGTYMERHLVIEQ